MKVITYTLDAKPTSNKGAAKNLGGFFVIDWDRNVCLAESKTYVRARNAWRKIMRNNLAGHDISIAPLASAKVVSGRLFIGSVALPR